MIKSQVQTTPYSYGLDYTGSLQAPGGLLQLSGWIAGFPECGYLVRLRLGQDAIFDCQTRIPRPDVAEAHPTLAGGGSSGFHLTTCIPAGFHIGTLEYALPDHVAWTPFHTLSVLAKLSPLYAQLEVEDPGQEPPENWHVRGWCFHPQSEIDRLIIHVGPNRCELRHSLPRADVNMRFPQFQTARDCGFSGLLRIGPGNHALILTAYLRNGSVLQHSLLPKFNVPNQKLLKAVKDARTVRAECVRFTAHPAPVVSIIIPIFNQLDLTLACLESLVRHTGKITFEVIIIDDKSEPQVGEILSLVGNLRLISNTLNQGFVLNCNRGAAEAKGEYLLFLNNDTEVCAGWLEALVGTFTEHPRAGAVGAKLVYPDGSLQEAGAIIWNDGSGHNFGNRDDANRPEYNYVRQVDYCSGACLLVPRQLFSQVGGFDTLYCPAYYEDADLAFAIRAAGREVYYQPEAVIIHHEGASSGTDTRSGPKKHQVINQTRFAKKWETQLINLGPDHSFAQLARDRYSWARLLVIDACALTPDADSGSLRMYNLLRMCSRIGLKTTFVADNLQIYQPYTRLLQQEGVEHLCTPHIGDLANWLEVHAYSFDLIILSRNEIAKKHLSLIRRVAPKSRIIFDTVDLMFLRLQRQAELEASKNLRENAARSKDLELSLCKESDHVFVVSPIEANLLKAHVNSDKISLISNIHEIETRIPDFNDRSGILFVGGYQHPPNVDAVEFFLDDIFPIITKQLPDVVLHLVGSNIPERIIARASRNVIIHGFVPDLGPLYRQVRLSIAPLRYGAGVKGKVNQSMAHGVPVVATTMAAEGMFITTELDAIIADNAASFADAVLRVHAEPDLWRKLSSGGLRNLNEYFSFAAVQKQLIATLDRLVGPFGQSRPCLSRPTAEYVRGTVVRFGRLALEAPYLGTGWSTPDDNSRWAIGKKATIRLKMPSDGVPQEVRVLVCPLLAVGKIDRQRISLSLQNHTALVCHEVTQPGPAELVWNLPDINKHQETLELEFSFPDATSPSDHALSADLRRLSFSFLEFSLV